eukprot:3883856-Rhodomonas_salina.2
MLLPDAPDDHVEREGLVRVREPPTSTGCPLSSYALAVQCPILTCRVQRVRLGSVCGMRYWHVAYAAVPSVRWAVLICSACVCTVCALCGTEIAYAVGQVQFRAWENEIETRRSRASSLALSLSLSLARSLAGTLSSY